MRPRPILALLLALVALPALARGTIERVEIRGLEDRPALQNNVRLALSVNNEIGKRQGESRLEFLLLNAEREAR